ncbi:MAG: retropepsin-like aspartic protease [Terriglobia bacterium]|jgi:predicted aspartyl protease
MSFSFDPAEKVVVVQVRIWGPRGRTVVRLALDTGATQTLLNWDLAMLLGYDPSASPSRVQITTGSGVEFAPTITVDKIVALGIERLQFPVLCHTLPPSAGVDGLLGLDFLRGQRLILDFRTGAIAAD